MSDAWANDPDRTTRKEVWEDTVAGALAVANNRPESSPFVVVGLDQLIAAEAEAHDPVLQAWFKACVRAVDELTKPTPNVSRAFGWAKLAGDLETMWETENPPVSDEAVPRIKWVPA